MPELFTKILSGILFFILHITNPLLFPKPLSPADESKYLMLAQEGDKNARSKLIEHNLRLVSHIIKKYYSDSQDQDDLISIGTIGLIKAIDTFNPQKGIRLSSYATKCIENEILMYFRSKKKTLRDISMDEPIETDKDGNALTFMDTIAVNEDITDVIDDKIRSEQLKKYIYEALTPRERMIILLRYGIERDAALAQREVALKLGISRSYVSRIEKKALEKLKIRFEKHDKGM